tara:strand:+ start:35299 stop:35475 length:177 start_codon:yes stop_codon:yes gene_type:complete
MHLSYSLFKSKIYIIGGWFEKGDLKFSHAKMTCPITIPDRPFFNFFKMQALRSFKDFC